MRTVADGSAVALVTRRFDAHRVPPLVLALIATFLALNLFASVEMVDAARGIVFFAITCYLGVFAIWLAGYVGTPARVRRVVRVYILAAVVSALAASLALFVSYPGHELLVFAGDRAEGLFKDPDVFAPFLIPAALVLVEEIVNPRLFAGGSLLKTMAVGVVVVGVVLSYSRAAWLNLALGMVTVLVVLTLRRGGGRRALVIFAVVVGAVAVVFSIVVLTGSSGFLAQRAHLQGYDAERFSAQALGLREGERYPFGIGPGQFDVVSAVSAHSTYIRAFAEEGLLGLLTLFALLFATLLFAARNAVRGIYTYGVGSAALLGAWLGLVANSLFIDTLHWRHLWFVAALIWAGAMRRDRRYAFSSTAGRPPR